MGELEESESNNDDTTVSDLAMGTVQDPNISDSDMAQTSRKKKKKKKKKHAEEGVAEIKPHNESSKKETASVEATHHTLENYNSSQKPKKKKTKTSPTKSPALKKKKSVKKQKSVKKKKISPTNSPTLKKKKSVKKHKKGNGKESATAIDLLAGKITVHDDSKEKAVAPNIVANQVGTDPALALFLSTNKSDNDVFEIQPSKFILESEKALAARSPRKPRKKTASVTSTDSPTQEEAFPISNNYYYCFSHGLRSGMRCGLPNGIPAGL